MVTVMLERTMVLWVPELSRDGSDVDALRSFAVCLKTIGLRCPFVEPLRLGLMALPVRSVARFFGGELAVCALLREDLAPILETTQQSLRIGIADGLFAAVLAVRSDELVAAGETKVFLATQPITCLHRSDVAELCVRLGIRTLGAFAALDQDRVLERFGADALHCHRVASGEEAVLEGIYDPQITKRLKLLQTPETGTTQTGFFGGTSARDERAQRIAIRIQENFGVSSVQVALTQPGRDPMERVTFGSFAAEESAVFHDAAPWPARLPTPSPMTIFARPREVFLLDEVANPLGIDGTGLLTGIPTTYVEAGHPRDVAAWAGPWPVTGPWWRQRLRRNRLQILTTSDCALLLSHEGRNWNLVGRYD